MKQYLTLALLALTATVRAQTPQAIAVNLFPARVNVGQAATVTVVVTNTSTQQVIEQATSVAILHYTDGLEARTVTSAPCPVYVQRVTPGSAWTGLAYAPTVPAPLVVDWTSATFAGTAVNPRVDTAAVPPRFVADSLPGGGTWTTTFTVRNP
jgi:uncharacterized protein (DUF58 family)